MNPSPLGGFAEGLAHGISGGTAIMAMGKRLKNEKESHAAEMRIGMGFKFYEILKGNPEAQKKALEEYVLPGFLYFSKKGNVKYSKPQINSFFKDIDMGNKSTRAFLDSTLNIFKEREKGNISYEKAFKAFDTAVGTYSGQLSGREEDYLKQQRAQEVVKKRKEDFARLFKPTTKTIPGTPAVDISSGLGTGFQMPGIAPTQIQEPSPLMEALGESHGPGAAKGISEIMQADVNIPFKEAVGAFPKKKVAPGPTTPMFQTVDLPDGGTQKMRYDPKTGGYTILFGAPKPPKEGHCFRLGHNYYQIKKGKSVLVQKGSVDEKAVMMAMKTFGYNMMPEPDQIALVAKCKRIILSQDKSGITDQQIKLTKEMAITLLKAAGGDKAKAREMARQQGYSF